MKNENKVDNPAEGRRKLTFWQGFWIAFLGWIVAGTGYCFLCLRMESMGVQPWFYGLLTIMALGLLLAIKKWGFASGLAAAVMINFLLAVALGFRMHNLEQLLNIASVPTTFFLLVYILLGGVLF